MQLKLRQKTTPIPRAPGVSRRAVLLAFGGRFTDEILSGLPDVLMPTIRAQLGLTYTQISLLYLALSYVAAIVEPVGGLLIDLWQRRWLLAWGAAGLGLAILLIGLAPTFVLLLAGFAVYGLASGPLAHTADVVLVEAHPQAPDRIFARATIFDTLGALLAPLLVTLTVWLGLSWRWLLISLGLSSLLYALLLWRTSFPPPANGQTQAEAGLLSALRENIRLVARSRQAWRWLAFLFVLSLVEAPHPFVTVWLSERAGMSQAVIGLYRALELAVHLLSLVVLERWLTRMSARRILILATLGLLLLYPLWLFTPGILARFLLGMPLSFLFAVYWPIGRAQSLASVPGRAGTVTAVSSLFGLVPLSLLFGLLAEALTLTTALLCVWMGGSLLLLWLCLRLEE